MVKTPSLVFFRLYYPVLLKFSIFIIKGLMGKTRKRKLTDGERGDDESPIRKEGRLWAVTIECVVVGDPRDMGSTMLAKIIFRCWPKINCRTSNKEALSIH